MWIELAADGGSKAEVDWQIQQAPHCAVKHAK